MQFCTFCLRSQNEANLIDTSSNSLLINNKCYEFSHIFNDLLQFSSSDEYICETCKDLMVSFYLFKSNIKFPQNHVFRLLIKNQIEDFLNQNAHNIEEIKVIRTVNSITLQCDKTDLQQKEINFIKNECQKTDIIHEENDYVAEIQEQQDECEYEAIVSYQCSRCDKIEATENESEIHEFLKHSTFGTQVQVEIENSKNVTADVEETFFVCGYCNDQENIMKTSDSLLLHLLNYHNHDILFQINEALNIPSHVIDFTIIISYLNHIKDCLQNDKFCSNLEYRHKKYFYEIYGELDDENMSDREDVQEIEINDISDTVDELTKETIKKEKNEKRGDDLSMNDKEWVRKEISKSKCYVNTETGDKRTVYRCSVTDSCSHISNSGPGLRYHLIMKHLKHRNDIPTRKREENFNEVIDTYPYVAKNSSKNFCTDCNLKFKDSRSLQLHENCHDLFQTIANYSHAIYPSCNTCNQKFVDQGFLQQHLSKHDNNESLFEPILAEIGALRQQGKILGNSVQSFGETHLTEYSWKCGHCENKNFSKEEFCNLHLLLFHTINFICPVDKMEFSGFKSVSLFIHHLRNKHPELFPNLSFKCTCCHMEFSSIYDKLNHMKICDRKNLQCDHCEKRFFKKGDLIAHLKIVTGEVQYNCSICNKKCISASDLKIHLRSHTKLKPYKCSLCTKSFRTLAARSAHVDAHNSNLVFPCEICGKIFKQRQLYRRHMKSIHENKVIDKIQSEKCT